MITRKYLFALLTVLMICLTFFCFNETDTQERYPVSWDSSYFTIGVGQTPVKTKQNWQQWLAQPFWPDDSESIKVSNRAGQKAAVSTCNQLFAADSKEMESVGANFHIYRAWAKKCYAGRAISRAADAKQSFVHDFVFNKTNIKQLPADLSMPISPDDEKEVKKVDARGGNLGHFLNGTTFTFKNTAETKSAHIAYPGYYTQNFTLIARGDFNHDGGEDLLVGTNLDANQAGTYSAYGLYIVSRSGPNAPYKLIRQLPIYGHDTSF